MRRAYGYRSNLCGNYQQSTEQESDDETMDKQKTVRRVWAGRDRGATKPKPGRELRAGVWGSRGHAMPREGGRCGPRPWTDTPGKPAERDLAMVPGGRAEAVLFGLWVVRGQPGERRAQGGQGGARGRNARPCRPRTLPAHWRLPQRFVQTMQVSGLLLPMLFLT